METNWAVEHLQIIRTLMERSALYRRALAPTMTFAGLLGLAGAGIGWLARIDTPGAFAGYWMLTSLAALAGAFLLMRRQALKDAEPFWSPPTRRVVQAMLPSLVVGLAAGIAIFCWARNDNAAVVLPAAWAICYGCALHAAGFFTPRGIKLLGWIFLASGLGLGFSFAALDWRPAIPAGHLIMGVTFGLLQLAYGLYLYSTTKDGPAA